MHPYETDVGGRFGAPMGRSSDRVEDFDPGAQTCLARVPLDRGGYDPGGAYWGAGSPLWCVWDGDGRVFYKRARDPGEIRALFPSAIWAAPPPSLDPFLSAYVECAIWSSCDDEGEPYDREYTADDVSAETLERMRADCEAFLTEVGQLVSWDLGQAGYDFWLTRNRHGSGFLDGDWPKEISDRLAKIARKFGEVYLYVGDDGKIHAE